MTIRELCDSRRDIDVLERAWDFRIDDIIKEYEDKPDDWRMAKAIRNTTRDFIDELLKMI